MSLTKPASPSKKNSDNAEFEFSEGRRTQLVSLEARMLFDGAVGASADVLDRDTNEVQTVDSQLAASDAQAGATTTLLVIDPSVRDWQTLVEDLDEGTDYFVLDPDADGLTQIAQALEAHSPVSSLHIVSHGETGEVLLGSGALNTDTLSQYAEQLSAIGSGLTESGDILLYGCDIGEGEAGDAFLNALAAATSADIAASTDLTGAAALGGNWQLEASTGQIEAGVAISAQAQHAFGELLAPQPVVTIGGVDPAGWEGGTPSGTQTDPLLGEDFTFEVTFTNNDPIDPGFAPYIDLFVPATGADGDDGLTVNSASYLGSPVSQTTITLTAADITSGVVAHPFYTDSAGGTDVTIPAGYVAGDQLMVFELPLGSFAPGQTAAVIEFDATVSELADVGTPLALTARSGFRYGADATDNPSTDPSIQGPEQTLTIAPQLYRVRTTFIGTEEELSTGPNYVHAVRIDVDVANGNTLNNLDLGAALGDAMQFTPVSGTPGTYGPSPSGAWTNVNGVLVSAAAADSGTPSAAVPGGDAVRNIGTLAGTSATEDASMIVEFYVPEFDVNGNPVLNQSTGDEALVSAGSTVSADWTPTDPRDGAISPTVTDPNAITIEANSISINKVGAIISDTGATGLSAGDVIEYSLQIDVSDYFAFGGASTGQDFVVTDTLSDGLDLIDTTTTTPAPDPTLVVQNADGSVNNYTLVRGTNYTVTTQANGQQIVDFNLRSVVPGADGLIIVGDLFDTDNTVNTAAGATLVFQARVLESYRSSPPDESGTPQPGTGQLDLNEGDWVVNQAVVAGTVLDNTLNPNAPGLNAEDEDTATSSQIQSNEITIDIVGLNGNPLVNDPDNPTQVGAGDCVTYRMSYEVTTGDFEDLSLQAFLPLPITDVDDPDADGSPSAWASVGFTPTPGAGEYAAQGTGGDGTPLVAPAIVVDPVSNAVTFDFGNRVDTSNSPLLVEVFFTICVNNQPFAPGLNLSAQGVQEGQNTAAQPVESAASDVFVYAAPEVNIVRGVVQDDVDQSTSVYTPGYTPSDPTGLVRPAGDTSANPLTGVLADTDIASLDTDLTNVDAGDTVRFAIVLDNQGRSTNGAFNVAFNDNLNSNIDPTSVANLRIVRGDGTPLNLTTDVRHAGGGALITSEADGLAGLLGAGLELVDPEESTPGAGGALPRGFDNNGDPVAAGTNVIVVTYDAIVINTVNPGTSASSDATLTNYAATEPGPDFTTEDPVDGANVQTAIGSIDKTVFSTDQAFTPDNNGGAPGLGDVVVGEVIQYQVVLQIPEGVTSNAVFVDTLDAASLSFVSLDNIVSSAGVSFDSGAVFTGLTPTDSGSGGDANQITFNLGNITNANTDNAQPDTITLTYSAVVRNVATVQDGVLANNAARLTHDSGVMTDNAPNMRVVEPAITVTNTPSVTQADAGDTVTYTVTLTAGGNSPSFDVALSDAVPSGMNYVGGSLTQTSGPAPSTALTESGGAISGGWNQLNIGDVVTYTFEATVATGISVGQTLDHTAQADWTSIPGGATDLSPFTTTGDQERSGADGVGGAVDDYVSADNAPVQVLWNQPQLFVVDTSESQTAGLIAAPGEIVRYRLVVQLPEATATNFELRPDLPTGLRYANDGTTTVGFISDVTTTGIDSSTLSGANLDLVGGGANASDPAVTAITPVLGLDGSAIVDSGGSAIPAGTIMASGDEPVFRLGDLVNNDSDTNGEFVVVEFNAVVENEAGNTFASSPYPLTFDYHTDGVYRDTSNTEEIVIGEPAIFDVDKTVLSVVDNAGVHTITYQVTFTNTGGEEAHNVRITDDFTSAPGNTNQSFDGPSGVTAPAGAVNNSTASALDVEVPVLASGGSVTLTFTTTAVDPDAGQPLHPATVTYTSLSSTGETLDVTVEDAAGSASVATTTSTGERTGDTADYGGVVNTYRDSDDAALGAISGQLWDDTENMNGTIDAGETLLEGVTVNMIWAGADGVFGNGDDQNYSTTTDVNGRYNFGLLPAGSYRMTTSVNVTDSNIGPLVNYFDRAPGVTPQGDGLTEHNLFEGELCTDHDFGYVRQNAAPTITNPGAQSVDEDTSLTFTVAGGNALVIADPDLLEANNPANMPNSFEVNLAVSNGVLDVIADGSAAVTGSGTASVTITGTLADINATLDGLGYTGNLNYNGSDAIAVTVQDHGNYGDADGDNIPNEANDDNLTASTSVPINIAPIADPPVANPDAQTTDEDTAVSGNALVSSNPGDQTDTDPDFGNGDTITVCGIAAGGSAGVIDDGTGVGTNVDGTYGGIVLNANGTYTYTPGTAAQALAPGTTVQDVFTYTICDTQGNAVATTITINITGVDDPVAAQPDAQSMSEDDPPLTGNAITGGAAGDQADIDPEGEVVIVCGIEAGDTGGQPVTGTGSNVAGTYGDIVLNSDGSYTYTTNAAAQNLAAGAVVTDVFTYTVADPAGNKSSTTITITVTGEQDNVIANPDKRTVTEAVGVTPPITGDVINAGAPGEVADSDIDGDPMTIVGVTGGTATGPLSGGQGTTIVGAWGTLLLNADGTYTYTPSAATNSIAAGETEDDVFTYTVSDGTGTDTTTLTICIDGTNDDPTAMPDTNAASGDGTPVTGNAISSGSANDVADTDPDGSDNLQVGGVTPGNVAGPVTGGVGSALAGAYGELTLNPDGSYSYAADPNNPTVLALDANGSIDDVFTYTVSDGNGGTATTTITITIDGINDPPTGTDTTLIISEDLTAEGGTPLIFSAADFGFTDPDTGDAMTQVCIDSVPASGTLALNGVPVTVGQVILVSDIGNLTYTPEPNANNLNLPALPNFSFRVQDSQGNKDPQPNVITIDIIPEPDPPVAPIVNYILNADTPPGDPDEQIPAFTAPSDPDGDALTITITALPPTENGVFCLNGTEVVVGQVLTQAELQNLTFKPNPGIPVPARTSDGNIPAGSLLFTVDDGTGRTADGEINIRLVPTATEIPVSGDPHALGAPPRFDPTSPFGISPSFDTLGEPGSTSGSGYFYEPGDDQFQSILSQTPEMNMLSPIANALPWETLQAQLDAEKQALVKAAAQAHVDDDCEAPQPVKPKPKPSIVKRSILGDTPKPASFSDQIKKQKLPVKERKPARIC